MIGGMFSDKDPKFPNKVALVSRYVQWDLGDWYPAVIEHLKGAQLMVTFEPWVAGSRTRIPFESAAGGTFPPNWLRLLEILPKGTLVRFAHEFNGLTYPWAQDPLFFQHAWRSFSKILPKGLCLVWSPNVIWEDSRTQNLTAWWPGDDSVGAIAIDGYSNQTNRFPDPNELFIPTMLLCKKLKAIGTPIIIGETAASTDHPDRVNFIKNLGELPVKGVIWFHANKPGESDYRLQGDPKALKAWIKLTNGSWR